MRATLRGTTDGFKESSFQANGRMDDRSATDRHYFPRSLVLIELAKKLSISPLRRSSMEVLSWKVNLKEKFRVKFIFTAGKLLTLSREGQAWNPLGGTIDMNASYDPERLLINPNLFIDYGSGNIARPQYCRNLSKGHSIHRSKLLHQSLKTSLVNSNYQLKAFQEKIRAGYWDAI